MLSKLTTEEKAKALLLTPLNIFGGTDGGVDFCILRENLIACIDNAIAGDPIAVKLLSEFEKSIRLFEAFKQPIKFYY